MRPALWALLGASLAASAWLAGQPEADLPVVPALVPALMPAPMPALVQQRAAAAPRTATPQAGLTPATAGLPARPADWPAVGLAALQAWQGQPDRPARAADTAAAPQAGPGAGASASALAPAAAFPYRWIGQLDDGGGSPQVLLSSAQRSVGVRLGQVLDGRWRIELNPQGVLMATALPDGPAQPVPGAAAGPPR